ncbi:hypothetical protein AX16_006231 [Volvariella volvacea WC 439]|nr:hypothetical protein AX16_006231 [Volvariella volvacea WC 439]
MVGTAAPYAVTGMVYAVVTLVLGFKSEPEITVYDAIISTSLSAIALLSIITLSLIYWLKYDHCSTAMRAVLAGHTIFLLSTAVAVTYSIPEFGYYPECFDYIYFVFFGKISIVTFRTITLVFYLVYLGAFIAFLTLRVIWHRRKLAKGCEDREMDQDAILGNTRRMIGVLSVFAILYVLVGVYIEVLRWYNRGLMGASDGWTFGQIMAFALCIVPVMDTGHIIRRHREKFGTWNPMIITPPTGRVRANSNLRALRTAEKGYHKLVFQADQDGPSTHKSYDY